MASSSRWLRLSLALAVAATFSASTVFSVHIWRRKRKGAVNEKVKELEEALKAALENCAAERQGRIRAQQALRKALANPNTDNIGFLSYPMAPIASIRSCFSTRNGTPRQPLLVPLARARLIFDPARVPQASLEGLEEYSHCWIIYVFHLNTDLEKLWKHPSRSKFKAKVRVPRLKGERMGIFSTRSPHRPCPIGLTVAKVEAVEGHTLLLSGVDLIDGTPVLDVKPYLPYCDSIQGATVPDWVKMEKTSKKFSLQMDNLLAVSSVNFSPGFSASLASCWSNLEKKSLYKSPEEFQCLISQVLSWDIRSVSQRSRPHNNLTSPEFGSSPDDASKLDKDQDDDNEISATASNSRSLSFGIVYHLILEGLDVSYRIDCNGTVLVEDICYSSLPQESN